MGPLQTEIVARVRLAERDRVARKIDASAWQTTGAPPPAGAWLRRAIAAWLIQLAIWVGGRHMAGSPLAAQIELCRVRQHGQGGLLTSGRI